MTQFPQYRKTTNERSFYKISNEKKLEEWQKLGSKYMVHTLNAQIYPEVLFIKDLIDNLTGNYEIISALEFDSFKSYCTENLSKIEI